MSRIAKNPVKIPEGIQASIEGKTLTISGKHGILSILIHRKVNIDITKNEIKVIKCDFDKESDSLSGTTRAIINNMVHGVSLGYEKRLILVGVGYRAQGKGNVLNLSLGFSHPIDFVVPEGIFIETPTQTEIVIKGCNKQVVGQVAANIRSFRPPEPYKGKGIKYSNENIVRKEAKKK